MWTKEKLAEAAKEYMIDNGKKYNNFNQSDAYIAGFLAGCNYIINNTQKYKNENILR